MLFLSSSTATVPIRVLSSGLISGMPLRVVVPIFPKVKEMEQRKPRCPSATPLSPTLVLMTGRGGTKVHSLGPILLSVLQTVLHRFNNHFGRSHWDS